MSIPKVSILHQGFARTANRTEKRKIQKEILRNTTDAKLYVIVNIVTTQRIMAGLTLPCGSTTFKKYIKTDHGASLM